MSFHQFICLVYVCFIHHYFFLSQWIVLNIFNRNIKHGCSSIRDFFFCSLFLLGFWKFFICMLELVVLLKEILSILLLRNWNQVLLTFHGFVFYQTFRLSSVSRSVRNINSAILIVKWKLVYLFFKLTSWGSNHFRFLILVGYRNRIT